LETRGDELYDSENSIDHLNYYSTDIQFVTQGIPTYEETEGPEIPPKGFWERVSAALF